MTYVLGRRSNVGKSKIIAGIIAIPTYTSFYLVDSVPQKNFAPIKNHAIVCYAVEGTADDYKRMKEEQMAHIPMDGTAYHYTSADKIDELIEAAYKAFKKTLDCEFVEADETSVINAIKELKLESWDDVVKAYDVVEKHPNGRGGGYIVGYQMQVLAAIQRGDIPKK